MTWHPWRRLREQPQVTLGWQDSDTELGHYEFACDKIVITRGMTQAERRCTLTHELIHRERGPVSKAMHRREERIVEDLVARRMIPMDMLVDAMVWCGNEWELAEHLWVDVPTIVTRLRNLTMEESRFLATEIDSREIHIP